MRKIATSFVTAIVGGSLLMSSFAPQLASAQSTTTSDADIIAKLQQLVQLLQQELALVLQQQGSQTTTTTTSSGGGTVTCAPGDYWMGTFCYNPSSNSMSNSQPAQTTTTSAQGGPTISLSVSPMTAQLGQQITVTGSSNGATSCTLTHTGGPQQTYNEPTSFSFQATTVWAGAHQYILSCTDSYGVTNSQTVNYTVLPPQVSLSVSPTTIPLGSNLNVSWSSNNGTACDLFRDDVNLCANGSGTCAPSGSASWPTKIVGPHTMTFYCGWSLDGNYNPVNYGRQDVKYTVTN